MTKDAILLNYELTEENYLKVSALTRIEPKQPAAGYRLTLTIFNNVNHQSLITDVFTGLLPLSGEIIFEAFPYFARHGCDFTFSAELADDDVKKQALNITAARSFLEETPKNASWGAHLPIRFMGWENFFNPVWSYCFRHCVSSGQPALSSFEQISLSLQPGPDCLVVQPPSLRLFYQDINDGRQEYKGSFIINHSHTCFQTCEALTDACCEDGQGRFDWLCRVTYASQTDPSHQETVYIILDSSPQPTINGLPANDPPKISQTSSDRKLQKPPYGISDRNRPEADNL